MSAFKEAIYKIELRKRQIENEFFIKNCGFEVDLTTEFANDEEINKIYKYLDKNLVKVYELDGKKYTISKLAKIYNLSVSTLRTRIVKLKWDIKKAVFLKIRPLKRKQTKELYT